MCLRGVGQGKMLANFGLDDALGHAIKQSLGRMRQRFGRSHIVEQRRSRYVQ